MNAAQLREAIQDHWRVDCSTSPHIVVSASLLQQRSKQRKLELCKGLAGFPSAKRAFADFWTAHIVQSGL